MTTRDRGNDQQLHAQLTAQQADNPNQDSGNSPPRLTDPALNRSPKATKSQQGAVASPTPDTLVKPPQTPTKPTLEEQLKRLMPQDVGRFLAKSFPPKTPLIADVLYRRDRISLTGRRRHGKTTELLNIAVAGACGHSEYLGFPIPKPFSTVAFFLEDDAQELQTKLKNMLGGKQLKPEERQRLHIYTRSDLRELKIKIKAGDNAFRMFIAAMCEKAEPQLIILDNLGMLVRGNYNDSEEVHQLMEFVFDLAEVFDAAVIVAAHPRKQGGNDKEIISLRDNREGFFESCMGSSHFINSTGSLWGIERDTQTGHSYLALGSQRVTGNDALTAVELNDEGWFQRVDDVGLAAEAVNNTPKRQEAWSLLPSATPFNFTEAWNSVKKVLPYKNSFSPWWTELKRNKLILPTLDVKDNRYQKAQVNAAAVQQTTKAKKLSPEAQKIVKFLADHEGKEFTRDEYRAAVGQWNFVEKDMFFKPSKDGDGSIGFYEGFGIKKKGDGSYRVFKLKEKRPDAMADMFPNVPELDPKKAKAAREAKTSVQ